MLSREKDIDLSPSHKFLARAGDMEVSAVSRSFPFLEKTRFMLADRVGEIKFVKVLARRENIKLR